MGDVVIQPLLAGLSTGLFCSVFCLPFILPVLAAEQRSLRATVRVLLEFILGRLGGYLLFGAVVGWLGERMDQALFNTVSLAALLLLSWLLVAYAVGLVKPASVCAALGTRKVHAPLAMGFLMGINLCPPFLVSIAYVFTLHSALKGMVYFLVFFAATTVYFIPMVLVGWLGRMVEFRTAARVSAVLVGVLFTVYAIYAIAGGSVVVHTP
jgi:sulfite exporter TauE/SafE